MATVGWLKDALAAATFAAALAAIVWMDVPRAVLVAGIAVAFVMDATFTLIPEWHHEAVGWNAPTVSVVAAAALAWCIIASLFVARWL
jgi:hypothetical protein